MVPNGIVGDGVTKRAAAICSVIGDIAGTVGFIQNPIGCRIACGRKIFKPEVKVLVLLVSTQNSWCRRYRDVACVGTF